GWGIDMAVLGAQKCLGAAPGVTPVHVGPRAWAMMAANPGAPRGSALSLLDWQGTHDPVRAFPFTPSILDLYALDGALDDLLAEGVAAAVARHGEVAAAVRAGVRAQGLGFWPRREALMADTVTAVRMPEGVDEREVRRAVRARFGVQLAGGDGELAGRVLRIGHMGPAATRANAARALAALAGALTE
ncbi:MAG TPA: hypothetical protein VFG47_17110, partial [Geminicoccaceae bacterium]|nr:hypothetical protein [Geminicoccaceae bacterium]